MPSPARPLAVAVLSLLVATMAWSAGAAAVVTATFDDLPTPPAVDSATGLQFTNNNSLIYAGVTWDANFTVVGDQYRVNPLANPPPNPLFGIPHSGHFFVTNQDGQSGLVITTTKVLTGAWFGRNQYYGFSEGGADQVTIVALAGAQDLLALNFELPDTHPGEPEPLSFFDTAAFASLDGVTGYRIDRRELGEQAGHWVADDFAFADPTAVPLPGPLGLVCGGLAALGWRWRRPG